jgi:hypothetical protein
MGKNGLLLGHLPMLTQARVTAKSAHASLTTACREKKPKAQ